MNLSIFMIYDSKAEAYLQPFFSQSQGTALRSFIDLANDPQHEFCKHAEDYTLFFCGTFDPLTGHFDLTVPKALGNALVMRDTARDHDRSDGSGMAHLQPVQESADGR